jgi:hypothetical protein
MKTRNPVCLFRLFAAWSLRAATIPTTQMTCCLKSAASELPPTIWEQYGAWLILAAVVLLALASLVAWRWLRQSHLSCCRRK